MFSKSLLKARWDAPPSPILSPVKVGKEGKEWGIKRKPDEGRLS